MRKKAFLSFALIIALLLVSYALAGEKNDKSLFVNLTSNETNRAAMAVFIAHRAMTDNQIGATIFINVEAVHLVNKNIKQGSNPEGNNPAEMLAAFIADGGRVIICPMCMKNVGGMTEEDLIDGVEMGGPNVWEALFADGTTVLSY